VDLRRDLKNLGAYCWEGQFASGYKTNADEELTVRYGQYLLERGYFTIGEIPGLFRGVSGMTAGTFAPDSTAGVRKMECQKPNLCPHRSLSLPTSP